MTTEIMPDAPDETTDEAPELEPEVKAEEKPSPAPARKARPEKPKHDAQVDAPLVTLSVYLTANGRRADQTAGFRHHAASRRLGKRTMRDWEELWKQFQARPVR